MAGKKVIDLPAAEEASGAEQIIVWQNGATKQMNIKEAVSVAWRLASLQVLADSRSVGYGSGRKRHMYDFVGALAAHIGAIDDENVLNLGQSGGSATGTGGKPVAGLKNATWAAVLQGFNPLEHSGNFMPAYSSYFGAQYGVGQPPTCFLVGLNDVNESPATWALHGQNAFITSMRSIISRAMSSVLWTSEDSVFTYGGAGSWTTLPGTDGNSGKQVRFNNTSGGTVTLTLPTDFPGGVVAMAFISTPGGATTLSGSMTSGQTTVPLTSATSTLPTSGNYILTIGSEDMLVTGGQGTTTLTVTRGVNGTSAATHASGDVAFTKNANTARVNFSGTASAATGSLMISGQGLSNNTNVCVKRFALTAADRGKTIIATYGNVITGDTLSACTFDSAWVEARYPNPVVMCNVPSWPYLFTGTATHYTNFANINAVMALLDLEFPGNVGVADLNGFIAATQGTLGANIVTTPAQGTQETWTITASGADFPQVLPAPYRVDTEDIWIVSNSGGNSYVVIRGQNGTATATHTSGAAVYDRSFMASDDIHFSPSGGAALGQYVAKIMLQLVANGQSDRRLITVRSRDRVRPQPKPADQDWIIPPCFALATVTPAANSVRGHHIWLPRGRIIAAGFNLVTPQAASLYRLGLWAAEYAESQPDDLLEDFGTVATSGAAGWTAIVNLGVDIDEGYYIIAGGCESGTAPSVVGIAQGNGTGTAGGLMLQVPSTTAALGGVPGHSGFVGPTKSGAGTYVATLPGGVGAWGNNFGVPLGSGVPRFGVQMRSHHSG